MSRAYGAVTRLRRALGLDRDRDVLVAAEVGLLGAEDLGPPAGSLGESEVHPQQIRGEQRGLLAPLPRFDLHDHVAVVVGVPRQEQVAQPVLELSGVGGKLLGLDGEAVVVLGELAGGLQVAHCPLPLAMGADDGAELRVPPAQPSG